MAAATIAPHAIAYAPQHPFWMDGATQRRFLELPPGTAVDASVPAAWRFPVGTRLWQEIDGAGERPTERRLLEQVAAGEWRFSSYVRQAGEHEFRLSPPHRSQSDCRVCHTADDTPVLGFSTFQLRDSIDDLAARGVLRGVTAQAYAEASRVAARSPLEAEAVGYLHGNCGCCHDPCAPLRGLGMQLSHPVDGALALAPAITTTVGVAALLTSESAPQRIASGDASASLLLRRLAATDPALRMPPLGRHGVDRDGVALLTRWIEQELPKLAATNPAELPSVKRQP
jgi:hypothetical protein